MQIAIEYSLQNWINSLLKKRSGEILIIDNRSVKGSSVRWIEASICSVVSDDCWFTVVMWMSSKSIDGWSSFCLATASCLEFVDTEDESESICLLPIFIWDGRLCCNEFVSTDGVERYNSGKIGLFRWTPIIWAPLILSWVCLSIFQRIEREEWEYLCILWKKKVTRFDRNMNEEKHMDKWM